MIHFTGELWPGPMEGVMSEPFVRAAASLDLIERWMTPFLRVSTACPKERILNAFLSPFLGHVPVTVQLMGTDPAVVAETAFRFRRIGVAGINLNFGCPSRQVTSGFAGGGALRTPEKMLRIVQAVRQAVPELPVSVKMRSGWHDPAELEHLVPLLAKTGAVDAIFLHYRTVAERYLPAPGREERLRRAVELAAGIPVILNGDIATATEAAELLAATGGAGVMIGRAWLRDPWLFRRFRGETAPEPEEGRRKFFFTVLQNGFKCCRAIELSNFLWGKENPFFERLKAMPRSGMVTPDQL